MMYSYILHYTCYNPVTIYNTTTVHISRLSKSGPTGHWNCDDEPTFVERTHRKQKQYLLEVADSI